MSADCKKACDSVRREGLCVVLTRFSVRMKLVRLIKCVAVRLLRRVFGA
jgi:hypothetical protein